MRYAVKILSLIVMAGVITSMLPITAFAASDSGPQSMEDYNRDVAEKRAELESKYDIKIDYPISADGYAGIGTATLATLDTCLEYVTPSVIKQLSAYLKAKSGLKLSIVYSHNPSFSDTDEGHPIASFTADKSTIELYAPKANSKAVMSGSSPTAIIHEIGHLFASFLENTIGKKALKGKWMSINGNTGYSSGGDWDRSTFVSAYAATSYDEDFADTFAYAFVCNRAGFSIAKYLSDSTGNKTKLAEKVSLIRELIAKYANDSETAINNLDKAYKTPESITYMGLKLSGSAMEYIGYNAPYGVLKGILANLDIDSASSKWEKSVGGWYVVDKKGAEWLVFPGGGITRIKK